MNENGASKFWMPNTDWMKLIVRSRQSSSASRCKRKVNWWTGMYFCGKQDVNFAILPIVLKDDQRDAVAFLLDGHDVLAFLLKGFRRSLIFQVFVIAVEMEGERLQPALVLCPMKSIINDRISEAKKMGFSGSSVAHLS